MPVGRVTEALSGFEDCARQGARGQGWHTVALVMQSGHLPSFRVSWTALPSPPGRVGGLPAAGEPPQRLERAACQTITPHAHDPADFSPVSAPAPARRLQDKRTQAQSGRVPTPMELTGAPPPPKVCRGLRASKPLPGEGRAGRDLGSHLCLAHLLPLFSPSTCRLLPPESLP